VPAIGASFTARGVAMTAHHFGASTREGDGRRNVVAGMLARDAASATTAILPAHLQAHGGSSFRAELTRVPRLLAVHFVSSPALGARRGGS